MGNLSHAAGWPSEGPTADQLKELFAQIASGRITKTSLQKFLRSRLKVEPKPAPPPDSPPPTHFTAGGRIYDLVEFVQEDELYVTGDTMLARAEELKATTSYEECCHIIHHEKGIPTIIKQRFNLIFPGWKDTSRPVRIACLRMRGSRLDVRMDLVGKNWNHFDRFVRRRA